MTSVVVLFASQIKLNIPKRKELKKFFRRSYIVILTYPCNAIKKMLDKISFYKHLDSLFRIKSKFSYLIEEK